MVTSCVQVIVCVLRHSPASVVQSGLVLTAQLMARFPGTVVGFYLGGMHVSRQ